MENMYNFLGNSFTLEEVSQLTDKILQNMIYGYSDMHGLYRDAMDCIKIDKNAEMDYATQFALAMYKRLEEFARADFDLYSAQINELIENNEFQETLKDIEENMDNYDKIIENLDQTLYEMIEVNADPRVKYETLRQQRQLINYMIKNLKKERDFISDYARDYSIEEERN